MCQQSIEMRLNEVVHIYIQSNGMDFVCENYMEIREEYYLNKEQRPCLDNDNESRE
jgi:hypothetical protein